MPRRPAVSAHRGGSERADAATWAAYEDAIRSGAEYVEFDVRRTADGVFVVHHDPRAGPGSRTPSSVSGPGIPYRSSTRSCP
jgi:glycerophosphoryl diester phosphodiesterase